MFSNNDTETRPSLVTGGQNKGNLPCSISIPRKQVSEFFTVFRHAIHGSAALVSRIILKVKQFLDHIHAARREAIFYFINHSIGKFHQS
jgi:hypothetical protein